MKIIHFLVGRCSPDSANGVHKTIYHLTKMQAQQGHEVAVFGISGKEVIPLPGIDVRNFAGTRWRFVVPTKLKADLLAWQPDVVHMHSLYTPEEVGLANWLYTQNIPYVETTHGNLSTHVTRKQPHIKIPYKYLFQLRTLNRSLFIHATSSEAEVRDYGAKAPVVVAYNAFDLSTIPQHVDSSWFYQTYPQTKDKKIFLFLGRLFAFQKGLDLMIQAFCKADLQDSVLVLVGPDSANDQAALEALVKSCNIEDRVIFTGPAYGDHKYSCFKAAHVFVHTSRWEGGAFTALESAAMKLPIMITPEADPTGKFATSCGTLKMAFTVESISQGFKELAAKSFEELANMGLENFEMIQREFNWTTTTENILAAYRRYGVKG